MYWINDYKQLMVYKKLIYLFSELLKQDFKTNEIHEIRKCVGKIGGYISRATGVALFPAHSTYYYGKSISWTFKLEKLLKESKISEEKRKEFSKDISEIKKMLFGLKKREDSRL